MEESYRSQIGIDPDHKVKQTSNTHAERKGQDIDTYQYDVFTSDGTLVAQYEIKDAMGIYPPQKRNVTFRSITNPSHSGVLTPD